MKFNWRFIFKILYWISFGIALHDYAHQVYELKGYHNLLEGGYIGFIAMIIFWLFIHRKDLIQTLNMIKRRMNK